MVVREWRGRAEPERADAYPKHFRESVVPGLRGLAGFVGAQLCCRQIDGKLEFLVLTRWRSLEAIRAFAGPSPERAVVEPGAVAALIDFDATVRHYEVIEDVASAAPAV
ncbi:MAG: antibiotic biosynthesis monooxygenase [Roseiarcus sp.]|jgi:heme-degrading monooxygenase HmoA|uniref:antibiotic biosynthesis monooxygenase family protein n=1 Tax=Roseiarcus sp. TaxID=1969460 RepID=UPI003C177129